MNQRVSEGMTWAAMPGLGGTCSRLARAVAGVTTITAGRIVQGFGEEVGQHRHGVGWHAALS